MSNHIIIQNNFSIVAETRNPLFKEIRQNLIKFCELDQCSDAVYIFKVTDLSIWNALSIGVTKGFILDTLNAYSEIPLNVLESISLWVNNFGKVILTKQNDTQFKLTIKNNELLEKITNNQSLTSIGEKINSSEFIISNTYRAEVKSLFISIGYPVEDIIGYTSGNDLEVSLKQDIVIRDYQRLASEAVYQGGNGTVILPCGSGKTLVGLDLISMCKTDTLILTNSQASVKQWKKSLLKMTSLTEEHISTYDKTNKEIKPVTITTYNMASYRNKNNSFIHFDKIMTNHWGLVIYDEVHLMPANMFRVSASFQSLRRMALTATFIREDHREKEVFTLIGPKRHEAAWKEMENQGYISKISLNEIRVEMSSLDHESYKNSSRVQEKFEIASMNTNKIDMIRSLINKHPNDKILIIGQFTDQLKQISKDLNVPMVIGETSNIKREELYDAMRNNNLNILVASKVANAALDIPNLNVVIQVSFQYGSRNEEAQRVGRATRPKNVPAYFYTLVSKNTLEEHFNFNRKRFLTNEGYNYELKIA